MLYVSTRAAYAVGTNNTGLSVWRSSDGGATFTETEVATDTDLGGGNLDIAVLSDGTVAVLYDDYDSGARVGQDCYTSTDSGVTFAKAGAVDTGLAVAWLAVSGSDDNLVATGSGGLYFSDDAGATWASKSATYHGCCASWGDNMLSFTPAAPSALRSSSDNGATWVASDALPGMSPYAQSLCAWSGGFAALVGANVYTSTTTSGFSATAVAPGVSGYGIYAVEEA